MIKPDEEFAFEDMRAYNSYMADEKHYQEKAKEWTKRYAKNSDWIDNRARDEEIE